MTNPTQEQGSNLPLWKRFLFSAILLIVFPGLVIVSIELAGRMVIWWKYGVSGKSYGLWQYDPELGAIHASHAYNSNSITNDRGFRNRDDVVEPKPAGALRIVAYGGSTTFCYNVPTDLAWPIRLESMLRQRHNRADQVLNAGAIMWSIGHEITRAKRDLPSLKPDVVILYSGVNEEANAAQLAAEGIDLRRAVEERRFGLFSRGLDQSRWVKRNSVIVRFMEYADIVPDVVGAKHMARSLDGAGETGPAQRPDPIILANFEGTLATFIEFATQNGSKPIYVIMGGLPEIGHNARLLAYSRAGAAVARRMGVDVLDAGQVVEHYSGDRRDLFAASGVHWSERGAEKLAAFIYRHAFAAR